MARQLFNPEGIFSVIDETSAVGIGWTLGWYIGETATATNTYSAPSGGSANANPLVADAEGRFSQIWLNPGYYKYVLKDADGATIRTQDKITVADSPPSFDPELSDFLAGDEPLAIDKGGTGQTSAANAIDALGGLPAAGGSVTGEITRNTKGVYLYHATAGLVNGIVYTTPNTDPDPTDSGMPGAIWATYIP